MQKIFKALWPEEDVPATFFELSRRLREACPWIRAWKVSAAHEGARQAWAMLQTHYPTLDISKVTEVEPKGLDGMKMKPDANFEQVMKFARFTELDCHLKRFIE